MTLTVSVGKTEHKVTIKIFAEKWQSLSVFNIFNMQVVCDGMLLLWPCKRVKYFTNYHCLKYVKKIYQNADRKKRKTCIIQLIK